MFSNVNEAVQGFYRSEKEGWNLLIDWPGSFYADSNFLNAWTQFFVQVEVSDAMKRASVQLPSRWCYRDNIIAPRGRNSRHLAPPADRKLANTIIDRHLRLRPNLLAQIDQATRRLLAGRNVLGLHIRGPGRTHGGVPSYIKSLRARWPELGAPPYLAYFEAVDRALEQCRYNRILLCTDAAEVRGEVVRRYGTNRVRWYNSAVIIGGETHLPRHNHGFSRRRLGEDVIIEAYLMSKVDFLVHGNSNVTNFVLCNAPGLQSLDIFRECYDPETL
jgi:hypothetical protein